MSGCFTVSNISITPIKWKPKMKFICPDCNVRNKHIVGKPIMGDYGDIVYRVKCTNPKCKEESYFTEDKLREVLEEL